MGELLVDNYKITTPIYDILMAVKSELTNGKLNIVENKPGYVRVTCPVHKDGHESKPSCTVYAGDDLPYGYYHCFTCDSKGPLWDFIAKCFDSTTFYAKQWLINNFGESDFSSHLNLKPINLDTNTSEKQHLPESILASFEPYHPYMTKRGISDEVIKKYDIKYDSVSKSIVFPIRDNRTGEISYLTRRSVEGKKFYIDKGANKSDIYLLYNSIKDNDREVYVVESQINALILRSWGYPAIAMVGAGTTQAQMEELNKTNIRHYILAYDGDAAGRKGAKKFIQSIKKGVFVDIIEIPEGKDVADLTKEEFEWLMKS